MKKYLEKLKSLKKTNKKLYYCNLVLIALIGVSFAYVVAQISDGAIRALTLGSDSLDEFTFEVDKDLYLVGTQYNLTEGGNSLSDTSIATVKLKANSTKNIANYTYNVYLLIDNNEFSYTTVDKKAEILLQVTDPNGLPLTRIDEIQYDEKLNGFDITEYNGLLPIAENYEISSNSSTKFTTHTWNVKIIFVNLETNQKDNAGKSLEGKLIIQENEYEGELSNTAGQFIKNLYTTQGANHLYLHNGTITDVNGNIMDAEDGSYRYAGGDYKVAEAHKNEYKIISDIIKFEVDPDKTRNPYGAYKVLYLAYDTNKAYYTSMKDAVAQAVSDGYVEQDEVANYVCFGSDEEECPYDNLYRIIGVFDNKLKLVKADYASEDLLGTNGDYYRTYNSNSEYLYFMYGYENYDGVLYKGKNSKYAMYFWNKANVNNAMTETGYRNIWSYSDLNKINLNTNFLNNIGTKWSNMISKSTWYIGGLSYDGAWYTNVKTSFIEELGVQKNIAVPFNSYKSKVGLMYLSEYYYGALPEYWSLSGASYDSACFDMQCVAHIGTNYSLAVNENWLYMGAREWFISRLTEDNMNILLTTDYGETSNATENGVNMVRPTFSLKSYIKIVSGTGKASDPYRIK